MSTLEALRDSVWFTLLTLFVFIVSPIALAIHSKEEE